MRRLWLTSSRLRPADRRLELSDPFLQTFNFLPLLLVYSLRSAALGDRIVHKRI